MQTSPIHNACASTGHKFDAICATPCAGLGTTCTCPPLIVLAVLSAEQATLVKATALP